MRATLFVRSVVGACAMVAAPAAMAQETLTTEVAASGLSRPVALVHAGDPSRAYIVQQRGIIRVFNPITGEVLPTPFIDLSSRVSQSGNERGLLGLAFHPDFASNGLFYVNYTHITSGDTVVAQFAVTADPDVGDPDSFLQLLTYAQPFSNHNGGWVDFGPDGYLYISSGDGGSANDPGNRAQTITGMLLGKMLRIDVNGDDFPADDGRNYAIPPTNPFVGVTGDDEIWAYGLRNPWRASFDRATGDLWIGDVGQDFVEEIDFQPASSEGGENYGWRCMEGTRCTGLSGCTCDDPALTMPIHEYPHDPHCSVTGGYVYRGALVPHLRGTYFFADYCSADIWSFRYEGGVKTEFTERTDELDPVGGSINSIVSFGEDAAGEVYICDLGGEVFRVAPRCRVDLNGDAMVNTQDVLLFLNLWNADDPATDFTGEGDTNTLDVLEFLNRWNTGCP
ncbi:MAG TPA: PQQ-dependent sugar dehydrogenase [Phycisphaerales bacterium]|nr:PQQ-dependent sugar dehydrogenase [Phycisphaerales bacterium]